jgi:hypothetical protein
MVAAVSGTGRETSIAMIEPSPKPRDDNIDLERVIWDTEYRNQVKELINRRRRAAEYGVVVTAA